MSGLGYQRDDGGRAAAGYKGTTGDCVVRALAIATGEPYRTVYEHMAAGMAEKGRKNARGRRVRTARNGVSRKVYDQWLKARGWEWHPTMSIGSGTEVHMRADELPAGTIIVRLSRHMATVVDHVVHDTSNPSRDGTRCVYGYWTAPR